LEEKKLNLIMLGRPFEKEQTLKKLFLIVAVNHKINLSVID